MALNNPFTNRKRNEETSVVPRRSIKTPQEENSFLDELIDEENYENFSELPEMPELGATLTQNDEELPELPEMGQESSQTSQFSAQSVIKIGTPKDTFEELFIDTEDEAKLYSASDNNYAQHYVVPSEDVVMNMIEQNIKTLMKKYPTGGVKSSRFITTDVLLNSPIGYFKIFDEDIEKGVSYVRDKLVEDNRYHLLQDAQNNPTDDAYQEAAYSTVRSIAAEYLQRTSWRGAQRSIVLTMICNEIVGFGPLETLWRDKNITEIICNGPFDIQVEMRGELFKVPGVRFRDTEHLVNLIEKLYGAINKVFSPTTPLLKGRLHDKSRMMAVHTTVVPDGPNFNIRKHPKGFWTPQMLIDRKAASPEMMEYLGNLIYKGISFIVIGGTHSGKSLTHDTIIHTPTGKTTMGKIKVGDQIIDHKGNHHTVTAKYPQPSRQVYKVTFSNGETVTCDLEHNWYVSTPESRKTENFYKVLTTSEMIQEGLRNEEGNKFFVPRVSFPITYSNSLDTEELPLPPYLAGSIIGATMLENKKPDVDVSMLETLGIKSELNLADRIAIGSPETAPASTKCGIPNSYLYATPEARRELFEGIMDIVAELPENKTTRKIKNSRTEVLETIIQLASSLGYITNKTGETLEITLHDNVYQFNPEHKSENEKVLKIADIQEISGRFEEMSCITVDSPYSTYLVGDSMVATHNTTMLNALTGYYKPKVRIMTLEDNLEMKPNPTKYLAGAMECKDPSPNNPNDTGITMRDLVKTAMQLRPDVLIIGEVTDHAAYDLCQSLNTGHPGASTIHANGAEQAIPRIGSMVSQSGLATLESSLEMISSSFDIIVTMKHFPADGSRRVVSIDEIGRRPVEIDGRLTLPVNQLWAFREQGINSEGKIQGYWEQVGDISKERFDDKLLGIEKDLTMEELNELSQIPEEFQIEEQE